MRWCGDNGTGWWLQGHPNPCIVETSLSVVLLIVSVTSVLLFLPILHSRRHAPELRIWDTHVAVRSLASFLSLLFLLCGHIIWLAYDITSRKGAPFELFSEALVALVWISTLVLIWQGWRHGLTLQFRAVAWLAVLFYAWCTYLSMAAYMQRPFTLLLLLRLIVSGAQLSAICITVVAEGYRPRMPETEPSLKEALLDVEAGNASGPLPGRGRAEKRGWYRLLLICLVYVWPESLGMQLRAAVCVVLVLVMRLLNLAVPIIYKQVVDGLSEVTMHTHPPPGVAPETVPFMKVLVPWVLAYMVVAFLQGGTGGGTVGLISNLRQYLWIPITQQAYSRICLDVFSHTLNLDLNFHLHRKTGEVVRVMDRGTNSIQSLLSTILFNIGPQVLDIITASIYLATAIQPWIAIIVFVTLSSYIPVTVYLTEWRGQFRRTLNQADNFRSAKVTDALLNYETVKYFNNEGLERNNFAAAIVAYQHVEFKLLASLNTLNAAQSLIMFSGLLSGLLVCTKGVANGSLTVGDTVLFVTLMQQLYGPLNFFGSYYRNIQQSMIDMESMFDLLATHPQIKDKPGARALESGACSIEVDQLTFQYTVGRPVLQEVTFGVPGGRTLALVGPTGSGKSSLLRLLFRFYEPTSGSIRIDGQNIADVTLDSLRRSIGVVPQDSVLFNDTVLYNIRYGRSGSSDAEVYRAAEAASIHESITTRFPEGYKTVVGERGLRLSGGEKQRVAFARAILKDAPILLLDEATSSLDSVTEKRILAALDAMRQHRTTVIVAHRLSTIVNADIIAVFKDGRVVEMASHPELVQLGGLYAEMWARQQESSSMSQVNSTASLRSAGSDIGLSLLSKRVSS